ncbi:hypothetical protein HDV00_001028 [Rhizophlyctis rosea]|nr:hypothetical protein HDV00_001028 [Rhizophlyctis rosea]
MHPSPSVTRLLLLLLLTFHTAVTAQTADAETTDAAASTTAITSAITTTTSTKPPKSTPTPPTSSVPIDQHQIIYLIRHGEKPAGEDEAGYILTAAGQHRAQCLTTLFGPPPSLHTVTSLLAPRMLGAGQGGRSYRTLIPTSQSLGIPITALEKSFPASEIAAYIRGLPDRRILLAWEHTGLHDIAVQLGVGEGDAPNYKGTDYDTVWEVDVTVGTLRKWAQGCTLGEGQQQAAAVVSAAGCKGRMCVGGDVVKGGVIGVGVSLGVWMLGV